MFGMMRSPAETYAKVGVDVAVETSNPHRLILMLFDAAVAAISLARIHMQAGDIPQKGAAISKAIDLSQTVFRQAWIRIQAVNSRSGSPRYTTTWRNACSSQT